MSTPQSFLLTDVRIFDGHDFIENGHVLVENGKVSRVGKGAPPSPAGVATISRAGHTVMPGLIDAHIHADKGNILSIEQTLKFGVTTVLDMTNEKEFFVPLSQLSTDPSGYGTYADYKYCAYCATIEGGWPENIITAHDKSAETRARLDSWPKLRQLSDVEPYVKAQKAHGAGWIKLMHETGDTLAVDTLHLSEEMRRECIKQAHAHGLKIVAHALAYGATCEVLREGVDGLTHSFTDAFEDLGFVELYKKNGAHCNPTLAAIGSLTTEGKELQEKFSKDPLALRLGLSPEAQQAHCRCMSMANDKASVANAYAAVQQLYKAGVPVIVGSDSAGPALGTTFGLSVHQEMYLCAHKVGMKPEDVLKAATTTTAERFDLADRGSIQPGRVADLLLIEGDPREHLSNPDVYCLPVSCVWRNGVVADAWKSALA